MSTAMTMPMARGKRPDFRRARFAVAVVALSGIVASAIATATNAAEPLAVGDKAPDFAAIDAAGATVRLADFRGKPLVLVFTRAHW